MQRAPAGLDGGGHQGGAACLVGHHDRGLAPLAGDAPGRGLGAGAVAVDAHDPGPLAGRGHRDGPPVAHGRVGLVARLRARPDDHDGAPREATPALGAAPGLAAAHDGRVVTWVATSSSTCTPSEFSVKATRW